VLPKHASLAAGMGLTSQCLPQIRQQARTLDMGRLDMGRMNLVRST